MLKRTGFVPTLCLLAAATAQAQSPGGGHGRGGEGGGGRGGGGHGGSAPAAAAKLPPQKPQTPVNQVEIVGVVRRVDAASHHITIAYEDVDDLHWPAGTLPFAVSDDALLKDVTVGEKVRFTLDNQRISTLRPY